MSFIDILISSPGAHNNDIVDPLEYALDSNQLKTVKTTYVGTIQLVVFDTLSPASSSIMAGRRFTPYQLYSRQAQALLRTKKYDEELPKKNPMPEQTWGRGVCVTVKWIPL